MPLFQLEMDIGTNLLYEPYYTYLLNISRRSISIVNNVDFAARSISYSYPQFEPHAFINDVDMSALMIILTNLLNILPNSVVYKEGKDISKELAFDLYKSMERLLGVNSNTFMSFLNTAEIFFARIMNEYPQYGQVFWNMGRDLFVTYAVNLFVKYSTLYINETNAPIIHDFYRRLYNLSNLVPNMKISNNIIWSLRLGGYLPESEAKFKN